MELSWKRMARLLARLFGAFEKDRRTFQIQMQPALFSPEDRGILTLRGFNPTNVEHSATLGDVLLNCHQHGDRMVHPSKWFSDQGDMAPR